MSKHLTEISKEIIVNIQEIKEIKQKKMLSLFKAPINNKFPQPKYTILKVYPVKNSILHTGFKGPYLYLQ